MASAREERWEWVEHLVPLQFLRALWDALFPKRFEPMVLDALDGTPPPGYARPLTFCLGCWLLFYAVAKATPWAFTSNGAITILRELPPAERHAVMAQFGLDTMRGVVVADTGSQPVLKGGPLVVGRVNERLGKKFGQPSASDVAQFLEKRGQRDLALRVRGYAMREEERPTPFSETTVIFFVVFGLVPGWWMSHWVLSSSRRTARETSHVHMYSDSLLVVWFLVPFSIATWAGQATQSRLPQHALTIIALAGFAYWIWRAVRLFRRTHGAPVWRITLAHTLGLAVAIVMSMVFALGAGMVRGAIERAGI